MALLTTLLRARTAPCLAALAGSACSDAVVLLISELGAERALVAVYADGRLAEATVTSRRVSITHGEEVAVWPLDDAFVLVNDAAVGPALLDELVVRPSTEAPTASCGRCLVEPGLPPAIVHAGDECPLPRSLPGILLQGSVAAELSKVSEPAATSRLEELQTGLKIAWPGECECSGTVDLPAPGVPLSTRILRPEKDPVPFQTFAIEGDGWVAFAADLVHLQRANLPPVRLERPGLFGGGFPNQLLRFPSSGGTRFLVSGRTARNEGSTLTWVDVRGAAIEVSPAAVSWGNATNVAIGGLARLGPDKLVLSGGASKLISGLDGVAFAAECQIEGDALRCEDLGGLATAGCANTQQDPANELAVLESGVQLVRFDQQYAIRRSGERWTCLRTRPRLPEGAGDPRDLSSLGNRAFLCASGELDGVGRASLFGIEIDPSELTSLASATWVELARWTGATCELVQTPAGNLRAQSSEWSVEVNRDGAVVAGPRPTRDTLVGGVGATQQLGWVGGATLAFARWRERGDVTHVIREEAGGVRVEYGGSANGSIAAPVSLGNGSALAIENGAVPRFLRVALDSGSIEELPVPESDFDSFGPPAWVVAAAALDHSVDPPDLIVVGRADDRARVGRLRIEAARVESIPVPGALGAMTSIAETRPGQFVLVEAEREIWWMKGGELVGVYREERDPKTPGDAALLPGELTFAAGASGLGWVSSGLVAYRVQSPGWAGTAPWAARLTPKPRADVDIGQIRSLTALCSDRIVISAGSLFVSETDGEGDLVLRERNDLWLGDAITPNFSWLEVSRGKLFGIDERRPFVDGLTLGPLPIAPRAAAMVGGELVFAGDNGFLGVVRP
ncbi:MAG: hypothetical protein HYV07_28800 [Deltaproteobacteria bacterium]|nr:hypothetical protein [Deltaproteobacteria bacterium]